MAAPITKLRIGLQPDTPEEHTRLRINVNAEEAQTALQIATDLRVRANPATAKIYYYNYDGSELLYTETIEPGGSGSWDGEPGRPGGEGYVWVFKGWATEPNATKATEGADAFVYTSRKVFAAYARRDTTGFIVFSNINSLKTSNSGKNWNRTMYFSIDAAEWDVWDGSLIESGVDRKIYLRGRENTYLTASTSTKMPFVITGGSGGVICDGNIEFLLDYESALSGEHPYLRANGFDSLFANCVALKKAPSLPAPSVPSGGYRLMFKGCTGLTEAPELPATQLASNCYNSMFSGCTGLAAAPELPAMTLELSCYQNMFNGCRGIKISNTLSSLYSEEYRIPKSDDGIDATNATEMMFANTGGTFTGTPTINTTYYMAPPAST